MSGFLFPTFLVMTLCGHATGSFVSQLESTVKVQPGLSTSLECQTHLDGRIFLIFWLKIPLDKTPVCIATTQSLSDNVKMCKQLENQSRVEATWNQKTFILTFSSVEKTDIATYICGVESYGYLFFGNGTKLILEDELAEVVSPKTPIEDNRENFGFKYLVMSLAATNVASIFFIILLSYFLRKKRTGLINEVSSTNDNKTDEVNYAALNFGNKQRRTVQKRTDVNPKVIYGTVRHQEEL